MLVKELIKHLKKLPPDIEVLTYDCEWGYFEASHPKITKGPIGVVTGINTKSRVVKKAVVI
jgi:hypothetical protein